MLNLLLAYLIPGGQVHIHASMLSYLYNRRNDAYLSNQSHRMAAHFFFFRFLSCQYPWRPLKKFKSKRSLKLGYKKGERYQRYFCMLSHNLLLYTVTQGMFLFQSGFAVHFLLSRLRPRPSRDEMHRRRDMLLVR